MSDIDKFFQEFEPGDKVRVTRKAVSFEQGWTTIWNPNMDSAIGRVFEVRVEREGPGVFLSNGYWFPTFVLERVDE